MGDSSMSNTSLAVVESDAVIVSMRRASSALAEARTIQQTKKVLDVAAAAEIYARRQKLGEEAEDLAASIKVEALRKLGEMLQAAPKAKGARTVGGGGFSGGSIAAPPEDGAPTLAELGLTKKESAVAQKLAALSEDEFAKVRDGHVSVTKAIAAVDAQKKRAADEGSAPAPSSSKEPPAPAPVPPASAAENGDDDLGSADELLEDLHTDLRRAEARVVELEKALAADGKEAVSSLVRRLEQAERARDDAMENAARLQRRAHALEKNLQACGRAVGELDQDKIVRAVQAFARANGKVAA
jgi:hypothetical protein